MGKTNRGSETRTNESVGRGGRMLWRRILPASLGGAAVAIAAVLMLVSPVASAAGVAGFSAPYTGGYAVQHRDPTVQGSGAVLTVTQAPTFSLATGLGTAQLASSAGPSATSDSTASYDAVLGVRGLGFTASTTGLAKVTAHWRVTWNATATLNSAAATSGGGASVEIWAQVVVHDLTAKTQKSGHEFYLVQKDFSRATSFAAGGVRSALVPSVSLELVSGHQYTITVLLGFGIESDVSQGSPAGSSATATIDLGSANHGASLASVTVG